jgi:hypothetical protein
LSALVRRKFLTVRETERQKYAFASLKSDKDGHDSCFEKGNQRQVTGVKR